MINAGNILWAWPSRWPITAGCPCPDVTPATPRHQPALTFTCCLVHQAVVRGVLEVHQVRFGGLPKVLVGHGEASAILVHGDLDGAIVLPPEVIPGLAEIRHSQPASPEGAGAADPVALALQLQEALHGLPEGGMREDPARYHARGCLPGLARALRWLVSHLLKGQGLASPAV